MSHERPLAMIINRYTGRLQSLMGCNVETKEIKIIWDKNSGVAYTNTSRSFEPANYYEIYQKLGDVLSSPINKVIRVIDYPPTTPENLN